MSENILISLALIILLGIGGEWLGWRFQFPSLVLFLIIGFIAGPVTGFINTDAILGKLLMPIVSISVAIILFEGGLSLRIKELEHIGKTVRNLITTGVLVSWIIITLAAHYVLGLNFQIASILGAILVVTGPTAIGPLLRHMQLVGRIGSIVKWEGIMIAPVGALLAVLVFETITLYGEFQEATSQTIMGVIKTILIGSSIGTVSASFITLAFKKDWIPDYLQNTVALLMVILAYTGSDILQSNAGLLSVTVMGIVLANQKFASVTQLVKFKEDLRVLLIPSLFIMLAARLKVSDLSYFNKESLIFILIIMLIARPVSVLISTHGSPLNWKEKVFLCWLAPRGIVVAAVSSIFGLSLVEAGFKQAEYLVPITFLVIIITVMILGTGAAPLARYLKLSQSNPQGPLIVGAHTWARKLAQALQDEGFQVLLVDTNRENISNAKLSGLPAYNGNIISETIVDELDLSGIGKMLALTYNDEVNSLAILHFSQIFIKNEAYQLCPKNYEESQKKDVSKAFRGRILFGKNWDYTYLNRRIDSGALIKKTTLTKEFDFEAFKKYYGESAIPLFLIAETKKLFVFTKDKPLQPKLGQILISLVDPPVKEKDVVKSK